MLLNGKDSCFTRIQSPAVKNYSHLAALVNDTISFRVNSFNTNFIPVVFNNKDSLVMNFDTGATEVSFTTDALKNKIKSQPRLYTSSYSMKVGNRDFESKVYDIQLAGNEVDGLLGWDMFDGMVVELDYDHNQLMIHSKMPQQILKDIAYSKFNIRYIKNKPFIESRLSQNGVINKEWFLFDLGYQRTVMLDRDLMRKGRFPVEDMKVIKKVMMHGVRGNEVPVITASLENLTIGKFVLRDVPAQLIEQNKPMSGADIHILGTDILKRFNTVLDFQKNIIYLKPNHLYSTGYAG